MRPEIDQLAARDREELAPRVAAYLTALAKHGIVGSVAIMLATSYQTTLLQLMEVGKASRGDQLDLPDPPA